MRLVVAAAVLAAVLHAQAAEKVVPPATVTVDHSRVMPADIPVLVEFTAPLPAAALADTRVSYLVDDDGNLYYCQVSPLGDATPGSAYAWASLKAIIPPSRLTYHLAVARPEDVKPPQGITYVSYGAAATFATPYVELLLRAADFRVVEQVSLGEKPLVPLHIDNLTNPQQDVRIVVTDRFLQADFELAPEVDKDGFEVLDSGPVMARVRYRGAFAGAPNVKPVRFESIVTFSAQGIIGIEMTIPPDGYDAETYRISRMEFTVPLILENAATLSFGGPSGEGRGREYWTGLSSLAIKPSGSYVFVDVDRAAVSGVGSINWIDYADPYAGLSLVWDMPDYAVNVAVEYSQDLLSLAFSPPALYAGAAQPVVARFYMYPHPANLAGKDIYALASTLLTPVTAEINEEYVTAVTSP